MQRRLLGSKYILLLSSLFFLITMVFSQFLFYIDEANATFLHGKNFWDLYICDVLGTYKHNNEGITSKFLASVGWVVFGISVSYFWNTFPRLLIMSKWTAHFITILGTIAPLILLMLIFKFNHLWVVVSGFIFGISTSLFVLFALFKAGYHQFFYFGLLTDMFLMSNMFVFSTHVMIEYLPIIQKVTFIIFLSWISWLNFELHKNQEA
jgi:hypothetical protein